MPNPLEETLAFLDADADNLPDGTTASTSYPDGQLDHLHVQVAWDGTPSDADNREDTVVRITVWGRKGKPLEAPDLAGPLRTRLLRWSSATCFGVERGSGRLTGTDAKSQLPFCSFTVGLILAAPTP